MDNDQRLHLDISTDELSPAELLSWWRLSRLPKIGPVAIKELMENLGDRRRLLQLTNGELLQLGLSREAINEFRQPLSHEQQLKFERMLDWGAGSSKRVLMLGDRDYPSSLAAINDPPTFLYCYGQPQWPASHHHQRSLAIVGSRKPSPAARRWTELIAAECAEAGITIISGLALGIDGAAHQGAISSSAPMATVAVCANGLDRVYPARHKALALQIADRGCLVSELSPGTQPLAQYFPARNRLISGLATAVLIVEANIKSGTMITARQAVEQGRDVLAFPGSVFNPLSRGPHSLIKQGAYLVENIDDIRQFFTELWPQSTDTISSESHSPSAKPRSSKESMFEPQLESEFDPDLEPQLKALICHIDFTPTATDVIAIRCQQPIEQCLPRLMQLQLEGWITQTIGGFQRLK